MLAIEAGMRKAASVTRALLGGTAGGMFGHTAGRAVGGNETKSTLLGAGIGTLLGAASSPAKKAVKPVKSTLGRLGVLKSLLRK